MKLRSLFVSTTLSAAVFPFVVAPAAQAYQIFFGQDLNGSRTAPLTAFPKAKNAEVLFLSNLVGVGTETFESFELDVLPPLTLNFQGAATATLEGPGLITEVSPGESDNGRYAISGSKFFDADSNDFSIKFSKPIAAFGFYGTDIGDAGGALSLDLFINVNLFNGDTLIRTLNVGNDTTSNADGSVLFYGLIAENNSQLFDRIVFKNSDFSDAFAFDNMTVGSLQQVQPIPEPTTILGTLAASAAGVCMKRRRQQVSQGQA